MYGHASDTYLVLAPCSRHPYITEALAETPAAGGGCSYAGAQFRIAGQGVLERSVGGGSARLGGGRSGIWRAYADDATLDNSGWRPAPFPRLPAPSGL